MRCFRCLASFRQLLAAALAGLGGAERESLAQGAGEGVASARAGRISAAGDGSARCSARRIVCNLCTAAAWGRCRAGSKRQCAAEGSRLCLLLAWSFPARICNKRSTCEQVLSAAVSITGLPVRRPPPPPPPALRRRLPAPAGAPTLLPLLCAVWKYIAPQLSSSAQGISMPAAGPSWGPRSYVGHAGQATDPPRRALHSACSEPSDSLLARTKARSIQRRVDYTWISPHCSEVLHATAALPSHDVAAACLLLLANATYGCGECRCCTTATSPACICAFCSCRAHRMGVLRPHCWVCYIQLH